MDVEPTQARGPHSDDLSRPAETVADGTLQLPDSVSDVPRVGFDDAEPTQQLGNGKPIPPQPTGESLTDMAPPTIASFGRPDEPAVTKLHRPGGPGDAEETVNLPTDEGWTPNDQARTGSRAATYQGSGGVV